MPTVDLQIPEWELSEVFIRSAGPGGQNVNKVSTGVQLRFSFSRSPNLTDRAKSQLSKIAKHLITKDGEIIIEATRFRTQQQNREDARNRLAALIDQASKPPPKKRRPTKPTRGSVERRLKKKTERSGTKKLRGRPSSDD